MPPKTGAKIEAKLPEILTNNNATLIAKDEIWFQNVSAHRLMKEWANDEALGLDQGGVQLVASPKQFADAIVKLKKTNTDVLLIISRRLVVLVNIYWLALPLV